MGTRTQLYDQHILAGARMTNFGGWEMPIHYGSQISEHYAVRNDAGIFDVSHMTVIDIEGPDVLVFLKYLLANDVSKLTNIGRALYTCMLNQDGGVIDDLIVYFFDTNIYRLVVNAATREKDMKWIMSNGNQFNITVNERSNISMVALQGPNARDLALSMFPEDYEAPLSDLQPFSGINYEDIFVTRTGYTGEDGLEIMLPTSNVEQFWKESLSVGFQPCGLGARDTLRLEAGMNLYGSDMDESTLPIEAGLGWTISWQPENRDFIGRSKLLERYITQDHNRQCGLVLIDKGILRNNQKVMIDGIKQGKITSGGYSPTLECSIGFARIPMSDFNKVSVELRGNILEARVVKLPFVRHNKALIDLKMLR